MKKWVASRQFLDSAHRIVTANRIYTISELVRREGPLRDACIVDTVDTALCGSRPNDKVGRAPANERLHLPACGTLAADWRPGSHDAGEAWR